MKGVKASKRKVQKKRPELSNRLKFLLPISIFLLAFLLRFIYLFEIKSSLPFFFAPQMDELFHDSWAVQIASGDWLGSEPFFRAPLYIYLLALVYKVFGHGLFLPRLFGIILGSLSCVLVFLIAQKFFNRTVGIISGVVACFYAMLIYYDAQLLITTLIVFLDLVLIGLLILTAERPKPLNWLFCGVVLGLSAIARPNILVFVPFILIWMSYRLKSKLVFKAILVRWLILCLGVLLLIFPVTLRNYVVGKDFVLIAWQGGYNFYLGNNPDASGWSATAPQIDKTWWGGYKEAIWLAEEETGMKLKPSQISDFWLKKGTDFVFSRPLSWLKLMARKTIYFWRGYEISNNLNIYLYKDFSSLFDFLLGKFVVYLPFGLLGPFSLLGLFICLGDLKKYLLLYLFVLSYSASVVLFFVCSRYRMPVIPFLIMFGSFFLWWVYHRIKDKKIFPVALSLIGVAILAVTLNTRLESLVEYQPHTDNYLLGISYQSLGKLDLAIEEYRASLKYQENFAPSHNNLGLVYVRLGKIDLAMEEYRKAILSDPSYEKPYYNLGNLYRQRGELDQAIGYYLKAIQANERYELAHLALGKVYYLKGFVEEAKSEWRKVLELNPNNMEVRRALELLQNR